MYMYNHILSCSLFVLHGKILFPFLLFLKYYNRPHVNNLIRWSPL